MKNATMKPERDTGVGTRLLCVLAALPIIALFALNIWLLFHGIVISVRQPPTWVEEFLMDVPPGISEKALLEKFPELLWDSKLYVLDDEYATQLKREITNQVRVPYFYEREVFIYIGDDNRVEAIHFGQSIS